MPKKFTATDEAPIVILFRRTSRNSRIVISGVLTLAVAAIMLSLVVTAAEPMYSKLITQTAPIAYQTTSNDDCSQPVGTNKVTTKGVNGEESIQYRVSYKGSKEISRTVVSKKTIKQPVTEVVDKGALTPQDTGSHGLVSGPEITQCELNCSVSSLTIDAYNSGNWTPQQYSTYVQQMNNNHCAPQPYCLFNTHVQCVFSSPTPNSGYDAGYSYAASNQICDTTYSNGNSYAFNQGVRDWASQNCTNGLPN